MSLLDQSEPPAERFDQDSNIAVQSAGDGGGDADSAYGESSDQASITTSIKSFLLDYVYENGRRYHRFEDGEYIFPNDEKEQDRLDMLHHIFLLVQKGALSVSPISEPRRVLDIGTGTGLWAIDFADQWPNAQVIGIDQSPIQPEWAPPNCRFLVDNLEQEWNYSETNHFDFIHQRSMAGSIGDWPALYRQAYANLLPGGWLEIQEFDVWFYSQLPGGLASDSAIEKWQKLIDQASVQVRRQLNCGASLEKPFQDAGFMKVEHQCIKTPIGAWPKDKRLREIGTFLQLQMSDALEAVTLAYFTRFLNWSEAETQLLIAQVRNEFNDRSKLLYTYCRFIYGQKPETA